MALKQVKEYFKNYHMENRIMELEDSSKTVELAAKALSCEPKQIAKTLSFKGTNQPILIVMAGDAKIDNSKFKETFHTKATMLEKEEVETLIGHAVGGVCPFAIKENVAVYLDDSLKRFSYVFPACGSSNSAIKLSLKELETHSHFMKYVDVTKNWQQKRT